jgi:hypothetical protein
LEILPWRVCARSVGIAALLEERQAMGREGPINEHSSDTGPPKDRRWRQSHLKGHCTFPTKIGSTIYIAERGGRRIARFRFRGKQVVQTLGVDDDEVMSTLAEIISALNADRFLAPGERPKRVLPIRSFPRLTLRDLIGDFLAEKRDSNGKATAATYTARLAHLLAFLETPSMLKRWPYARNVDRDFVVEHKRWLFGRQVTANGRAGAASQRISSRGVYHALETLRNALH